MTTPRFLACRKFAMGGIFYELRGRLPSRQFMVFYATVFVILFSGSMFVINMDCTARRLSEKDLRAIKGGGIATCQTTSINRGSGWRCFTTGSFACSNLCDPCPGQSFNNCGVGICWKCQTANKLRECSQTGVETDTCVEMGAATGPCTGNRLEAQCQPDGATQRCFCPTADMGDVNTPCARHDCSAS